MNIMSAFIYGIVTFAMISNLIFMMVDSKRMRAESKRIDKMGDDILKDIEIGQLYIEKYSELEDRIEKLENKKTSKNKKEEA